MSAAWEWKDDQRQALDHQGNLVLTASAGTGKTTILVERFINTLMRTARAEESADILHRMVGITFTELAAAQLKERLRTRIIAELARNPGIGWLQAIERDLDSAYIGTIHGFCRRLLKENFVAAGLSPAFGVIDAEENRELKSEICGTVIREYLDSSDKVLEIAGEIGFGNLREMIIGLVDSFHSDGMERIDPESLLATFRELWLREVAELLRDLLQRLRELKDIIDAFNSGGLGGKPSASTHAIAPLIDAALPALHEYLATPERILAGELPSGLMEVAGIRKPGNKGLEEFKEKIGEFRALVGHEDSRQPLVLRNYLSADAQRPYLLAILSAARDYAERFQREKDASELLDFDDLLLRARTMLRDNPDVRGRYHAQFAHIFVDEFQDVNAVQREIIELLHGDPGQTLFIVGDGKQSIYRFRAADVLRFKEFCAAIGERGGKQLNLASNFRSAPMLLQSFNALFHELFSANRDNRYQIEYQPFVPGKNGTDSGAQRVEFITYEIDDRRHEGMLIARRIGELVGSAKADGSPWRYGDIAILLRKFSNISQYETELRRNGIPYTVIGGRGFHLQREIWDLASYLQMVWFADDQYALATVLRSPLCLLSDETMLRLARADCLNAACFERAEKSLFDDEEWERFALLRDLVAKHRRLMDALPLSQLLVDLLDVTGYEAVLLARDGGDQGAANARKLIELARQYEMKGSGSPQEFVLELQAGLFSRAEEAQALVADLEDQSVKILTVHKAKGLEFPVVILPHFHGQTKNETDRLAYERRCGVGFRMREPDRAGQKKQFDIVRRIRGELTLQDEAEELRLLYVAMTRAKERVIIPWVEEPNSKGRSWWKRLSEIAPFAEENRARFGISLRNESELPSPVRPQSAAESLGLGGIGAWPGAVAADAAIVRLVETATGPDRRSLAAGFRGGVWQLIDRVYHGRVEDEWEQEQTALERAYAAGESIDAPGRKDTGSAVHALLERWAAEMPQREEMIAFLLQHGIDPDAAVEAADQTARWLLSPEGQAVAAAKLHRETPFFFNMERNGAEIELGGTIDAVAELPDGSLWLLDYKFARAKADRKEYELQLRLYALALKEAFGRLPDRALLVFLRDAVQAVAVDLRPAVLEETRDLVFDAIESPAGVKPG